MYYSTYFKVQYSTVQYSTVQHVLKYFQVHACFCMMPARGSGPASCKSTHVRRTWRTSDPRGAVRGELRMDRFPKNLGIERSTVRTLSVFQRNRAFCAARANLRAKFQNFAHERDPDENFQVQSQNFLENRPRGTLRVSLNA